MVNLTNKQQFDLYIRWPDIKFDNEKWWQQEMYWSQLSFQPNLPEDFIREYKDFLDWAHISHYQKLSEDFIREFQDYVYWPIIFLYQKDLSQEFIIEFKDKAPWHWIFSSQVLKSDTLDILMKESNYRPS